MLVVAGLLAALDSTAAAQQGEQELIAVLQNADAAVFDKAKACQRLAVIGTAEAVPALAALLPDETLNLYARSGLEGIADPAADAALREAAGTLTGRQLVGVIDSLGQRRDVKAIDLLGGLLTQEQPDVVTAAARVLGKIATTEAAELLLPALANNEAARIGIADGCLACAEGLAASDRPRAIELYRAVAGADVPKHLRVAAIRGQLQIEGAAARDLLVEQIRSEDESLFRLGLAVAREVPGAEITSALADEIAALPPARQALLLLALGDRKDPAPLAVVLAAGRSDYPEVREAAIRVLARIGDASAVAVLLEAALGEGEVAATARERLKTVEGAEVDATILERLAGAEPQAAAVLLELAGARRIAAALPTVKEALTSQDDAVRLAAIAALGQVAELEDLGLLTDRALAGGTEAEQAAAQAALRAAALRIGDREACTTRLAALLEHVGNVPSRTYLLELLGQLGGSTALGAVVADARGRNADYKEEATHVLGEWPNAEAAPALLEVARTDADAKYRIRALRGYLRIARQLQLPAEEKLAMFRTALEVAERDEERQLALDVLTRIPSAETLALAVSYLDQPALQEAAATAAVKIAPKLLQTEPQAVAAAMQKIVDAGVQGNAGARAKQLLGQAKGGS
jgi:HEAT repeat protein